MNKCFYLKLAASNIKKNRRSYAPYIFTCIVTISMYYIILSLCTNIASMDSYMFGGRTLATVLNLGAWITAIFAVIFLFYTNSFLIKRRKKEFGLFNILGMEKKHLLRVVLYETFFIGLISMICGILVGVLFNKLVFLAVLKVFELTVTFKFNYNIADFAATLILFSVIFLLIYVNNIRQIHLAKPVELLKGDSVHEKEPKSKWLLTLIGIVSLSAGYYISISTEDPLQMLLLFFVAVILVIIGTYCLFTAGSITLLKAMRKNKSYYYKTNHFISVSGMIHRMKQNAVGLGNICILSTMVLVMISSTLSLYIGMSDSINATFQRDISIFTNEYTTDHEAQTAQQNKEIVYSALKELNLSPINEEHYQYLLFAAKPEGNNFITNVDQTDPGITINQVANLVFIPIDDYNRITGSNKSLAKNEVFLYSEAKNFSFDSINIFNKTFAVKEYTNEFIKNGQAAMYNVDIFYIVVSDVDVMKELLELQKIAYENHSTPHIINYYGFNLDADKETRLKAFDAIRSKISGNFSGSISSKDEQKNIYIELFGGLLFTGIFLGILFTMAAILIIYYKQLSEGYEDKQRFEIMQKVGMDEKVVKKAIHSQILTVFFLPLITAGIHIAAAFPAILKILSVLEMNNTFLFAICTAICFIVFAIFYACVYSITAKVYYKIVKR